MPKVISRPFFGPPVLTPWERFRLNPPVFLVQWLQARRLRNRSPRAAPPPTQPPISVVCLSDTHTTQPRVPDGDLLLHAGDLSGTGSFEEIQAQLTWLNGLPHRHKVVIGGNHDLLLDPAFVARQPHRVSDAQGRTRADLDWGDVVYLCNTSARLDFGNGRTLAVYGSPWTPAFGNWAFQFPKTEPPWEGTIPPGTDILLTHGPPKGHLDDGVGCAGLLKEIWRARPRLVVFGHIHQAHGVKHIAYDKIQSAYDGVITGDRGLLAVFVMACRLLGERIWDALPLTRGKRDTTGDTALVNAAMVQGWPLTSREEVTVISL